MPRHHITKLPALLVLTFLIGIPATGCVAHPPHRTVVTYEVRKAEIHQITGDVRMVFRPVIHYPPQARLSN